MRFISLILFKKIFAVLLLALCWSPVHAVSIFILHSYSQEYTWTRNQHSGFIQYLGLDQQNDLHISTEYLDTKRRTYNAAFADEMLRHLSIKYADYQPDIIYVTDDNALDFARHHLNNLFPDIPIVFSGVNNYGVLNDLDPALITGVFEKKEITPNIQFMAKINASTGKLVFAGDTSNTYQAIKHEIQEELKNHPHIKANFISANIIDDIINSLQQCQCEYVYLTTIGGIKDNSGQNLSLHKIITAIAKAGDFALLSMEDAYLIDGVLGGYVTSGKAQGKEAARIVAKILSGTAVFELSPVLESPNEYIFSESELVRLGITLPDEIQNNAIFLHTTPSYYQTNRTIIIAVIVLLATTLFTVLIVTVALLARRRNQLKQTTHTLTEQRNALIQARKNLEVAQRIAQMGSWSLDLLNNQLAWSDEIYRIFEIDKTETKASYETFLNAIHPDDRERVNTAFADSIKNKTSYSIDHRLLMPDGRIKYVMERGETTYNSQDEPVFSYGTVQDISQKKLDEQHLKQWASIFESTIEAVIITDTNQYIVDVNRAYTEITGYSKQEALGKRPNFRKSGRHDASFFQAMWESIYTTGAWSGEIWNRTRSGELSPEWHSISTLYDENGNVCNYVGVFTDISVLKRSEEKLEHLANHDPLTGLANRSLLIDRLEQVINRLRREPDNLAVLYLDLDRFKKVNDTQGHPVGDTLLQEAATRLQAAIRVSDTVGRLGGDEFLILVEGYDNINDVKYVAENIRQTIEQPFLINGNKLYISVSIGISLYPVDGKDSSTLIRNADSALYRAKETGRNNFSFYDYEITKLAASRLEIENILHSALDNNDFKLFFQPKIDLASGNIVGAEALIRLQNHGGAMLPPDEFIHVAEETGLIIPIGRWVLEQAVKQLVKWNSMGIDLNLAINISAIQIQRGEIIQTIIDLQKKYKFNPSDIELEVTESVLIDFPEKAVEVLSDVRNLGLSVALDDFGTGFSSLSNLKRYPISTIKIDKSFVQDILEDTNDAAITRAVIAMGRSLDLLVVAEGVETASHEKYLQDLGCQQAQGYFYSRPVPVEEFNKLLLLGNPAFSKPSHIKKQSYTS